MTEGAKKVFDEDNALASGFCGFQILDQDGYPKKHKGCAIEGPWFFESEGNTVALVAVFSPNPLFYLEISSEADKFLYGKFWLGEKASALGGIVSLIPKKGKVICDEMQDVPDQRNTSRFLMEAEMPLAGPGLIPVIVETKTRQLVTKVTKIRVEIPAEKWVMFKMMRLKFWRFSKAWGGEDKDKEKDKDEKKEDGEEEEKEGGDI